MDKKYNFIPPVTDIMGRFWPQPGREGIALDDTHALMTQADFDRLLEYSNSIPTGLFTGKMWKSIGPEGYRLNWLALNPEDLCLWRYSRPILVA